MDVILYALIAAAAAFAIMTVIISTIKDLRRSKGRHVKKGTKVHGKS